VVKKEAGVAIRNFGFGFGSRIKRGSFLISCKILLAQQNPQLESAMKAMRFTITTLLFAYFQVLISPRMRRLVVRLTAQAPQDCPVVVSPAACRTTFQATTRRLLGSLDADPPHTRLTILLAETG
jgi:hypothetical protein